MKLYHVTTHKAATAIMAGGFRDHARRIGGMIIDGVWVSDAPWYDGATVDAADLPASRVCIVLALPADQIGEYELVQDDSMYREWCIPAAILNQTTRKRWTSEETTTSIPPPGVRVRSFGFYEGVTGGPEVAAHAQGDWTRGPSRAGGRRRDAAMPCDTFRSRFARLAGEAE